MSATVINPYAFAEERVVNGNFSNTTGMTNNAAGWWGRAVPAGWGSFTIGVPTSDFLIRIFDGVYYANLNVLSRSPAEAGGTLPFYQDFTLPATSDVTLTFFGSNPFNTNAWSMGVNIANRTTAQTLATHSLSSSGTIVLTASNVPAGHAIRVNFWKGSVQHTPAISNVSVVF